VPQASFKACSSRLSQPPCLHHLRRGLRQVVPGKKGSMHIVIRYGIGGIKEKQCTVCKKWKPLTSFRLRGKGSKYPERPRAACIQCDSIRTSERNQERGKTERSLKGLVPMARIQPLILELVARIGKAEASRRIGIKQQTMWYYYGNHRKWIARVNAERILRVYREVIQTGEKRTYNEIRHPKSLREARRKERNGERRGGRSTAASGGDGA
jgi:hypothetical protein